MKKIFRKILNPFKDIIGLGYGKCKCCGFHWNTVDWHNTYIDKHQGMFAVCEDCWKTKSDEEIIEAYNRCYDAWLTGDKYNKPNTVKEIGFSRKDMLDALKSDLACRNARICRDCALLKTVQISEHELQSQCPYRKSGTFGCWNDACEHFEIKITKNSCN